MACNEKSGEALLTVSASTATAMPCDTVQSEALRVAVDIEPGAAGAGAAATLSLAAPTAQARQKTKSPRRSSDVHTSLREERLDETRSNASQGEATPRTPLSSVQVRPRRQAQAAASRTFEQIRAEHEYLFTNLHQQDARIRTLINALASAPAQLQDTLSRSEARRLRKNTGFLQSKIADAEQQERMVMVRLGEVCAEMQSLLRRAQLAQMQQQQQQQQHRSMRAQGAVRQVDQAGELVASPTSSVQPPLPTTPRLLPHEFGVSSQDARARHAIDHLISVERHLAVPTAFVVSPLTPGLSTAMAASPVSASPLSLPASPVDGFMSPMSPLAPAFEPGVSCFLPLRVGHDKSIQDGTNNNNVLDSGDQTAGNDTAAGAPPATRGLSGQANPQEDPASEHCMYDAGEDTDSDAHFLPKAFHARRLSHTPARSPPAEKQKRMSLPPLRFSWAEEHDE